MIKTFSSKETEKIWEGEYSKKFPLIIQKRARMKLRMIHNSQTINDLRIPPANHLEKLLGHEHLYSIRINDQWRICFVWEQGNAYDVEIIDYHS
ncbi:MAG: type II toxin-antitoxin system RelE/ParE family toxin [Candidatus Magasanikbacteria bacterium]|nr:type II toxin-antitoxin system RelE/ParE family toxin [Candidatus Magasanikbacteria bacterium]